jgi:hypothetical protein
MPKPAGKTMNVLRWIFGIPLAFVLGFGLLYVVVTVDTRPPGYSLSFSFAFRVLELIIILGVPVFLSCLFTPSPKKYAGLISVSIITLFTVAILVYVFIVNPPFYSVIRTVSVVSGYMMFIAGSSIGFAVSYTVFKNKGWERKPKNSDAGEFD